MYPGYRPVELLEITPPIPVAALVAYRCRRWAAIMGFFSGPVVGYCQHPLFGLVEYDIDLGVEVRC